MSGARIGILAVVAATTYGVWQGTDPAYGFLGFVVHMFAIALGLVLLAAFAGMILWLADLGGPVKIVIGRWFGYEYQCPRYDDACRRWVKKGEVSE